MVTMRLSHRGLLKVLVVATLLFRALSCSAQDAAPAPADPAANSPAEKGGDAVSASAESIQLFLKSAARKPLEMQPVFQWADPVLPEGKSLCLLYFHQGRPVASCKVYRTRRAIVHTFISMTDQPLVARADGEIVWTPPKSGLEFHRIVGARPSDNASRRRIQMKSIAGEFSAITGDGEAKRQQGLNQLRLLPTPLHRYPDDRKSDDGIFDGAVFAFVVGGGNPQFFLVLEAAGAEGPGHWRYAFSRRTLAKLEVFHKEQPVWDAAFFPRLQMTRNASFCKIDLPLTSPKVE